MRTPEQVIKDALQKELGNAEDNLYRAKHAAEKCNPDLQWGQSGQTLNEIIAEYQQRVDEVKSAI